MTKAMPIKISDAQPENQDAIRTLDAEKLLDCDNTVQIILGTQVYTLRKTRQNKLLLTK